MQSIDSLSSSASGIYSLLTPRNPSIHYLTESSASIPAHAFERERIANVVPFTKLESVAQSKSSDRGEGESEKSPIYSLSTIVSPDNSDISKGGVAIPFPYKLHIMLEAMEAEAERGLPEGKSIVSWMPHGRAFKVHKPARFVQEILAHFFSQTKYASFQRQLNLYGFSRITNPGPDKGAVHHECFVRHKRDLVQGMVRKKVKGTKFRRVVAPEDQPDFYKITSAELTDTDDTNDVTATTSDTKIERTEVASVDNGDKHRITPSAEPKIDLDTNDFERHHHLNYDHLRFLQDSSLSILQAMPQTVDKTQYAVLRNAVNAVEEALEKCNEENAAGLSNDSQRVDTSSLQQAVAHWPLRLRLQQSNNVSVPSPSTSFLYGSSSLSSLGW